MGADKAVEGMVCPKHPEVEAFKRCTSCFKPMCRQCTKIVGELPFCSDACSENHFRTTAHFEATADRERRRRLRKRITQAVIAVVVLGGGSFAAVTYFKGNPDTFETLKEKAGQAAEQAKEKATEVAKDAAGDLDVAAKTKLNSKLEGLEKAIQAERYKAAAAFFSPTCKYLPYGSKAPVGYRAFLENARKNRRQEFRIEKDGGWEYNKGKGYYRILTNVHHRETSQGGISANIQKVRFTFKQIDGKWTIIAVQDKSAARNRRG